MFKQRLWGLAALAPIILGCGSSGIDIADSDDDIADDDQDQEVGELSDAYLWFGANVTIARDGNEVVIEATGRPDHQSCYWDPSNSSGLYVECDPDITSGRM